MFNCKIKNKKTSTSNEKYEINLLGFIIRRVIKEESNINVLSLFTEVQFIFSHVK